VRESVISLSSDGAQELLCYLREDSRGCAINAVGASPRRRHLWCTLATGLAKAVAQAAQGLAGDLAKADQQAARKE
jgi:hypothetical protein